MRLAVSLQSDFPPWQTVYGYFAAWRDDGTLARLHGKLRAQIRAAAGRVAQPTAAVIDSQSVRASDTVPKATRGWDAAKKVNGRKRHIAVDTTGLLLDVVITPASVQDRDARPLLWNLHRACPRVQLAWADSGYQAHRLTAWATALHITLQIVRRPDGLHTFTVLPRRWVVERTFAWISKHRRTVRDYEHLPASHEAMILWAMIALMTRRLAPAARLIRHSLRLSGRLSCPEVVMPDLAKPVQGAAANMRHGRGTGEHSGRRTLPQAAAFWILAVLFLMLFFASAAASPLYPVYQAQFRFSATTLTAVFAVYVLVLLVTLLFFGSVSDYLGRLPVIITALVFSAAACGVFLAAHGVGALYVARSLQGIATGLASGPIGAALIDLQPAGSQRAPVVTSTFSTLGLALGALITSALVQYAPAPTHLIWWACWPSSPPASSPCWPWQNLGPGVPVSWPRCGPGSPCRARHGQPSPEPFRASSRAGRSAACTCRSGRRWPLRRRGRRTSCGAGWSSSCSPAPGPPRRLRSAPSAPGRRCWPAACSCSRAPR